MSVSSMVILCLFVVACPVCCLELYFVWSEMRGSDGYGIGGAVTDGRPESVRGIIERDKIGRSCLQPREREQRITFTTGEG